MFTRSLTTEVKVLTPAAFEQLQTSAGVRGVAQVGAFSFVEAGLGHARVVVLTVDTKVPGCTVTLVGSIREISTLAEMLTWLLGTGIVLLTIGPIIT